MSEGMQESWARAEVSRGLILIVDSARMTLSFFMLAFMFLFMIVIYRILPPACIGDSLNRSTNLMC